MNEACPWCSKIHAQWGLLTTYEVGKAALCLYCGRWCVFDGMPGRYPPPLRRATATERAAFRLQPAGAKLRETFIQTGRKPPTRRRV